MYIRINTSTGVLFTIVVDKVLCPKYRRRLIIETNDIIHFRDVAPFDYGFSKTGSVG